ncbi:hypothetical protein APSETT444_006133 [Aspergillus pseudonomiae]
MDEEKKKDISLGDMVGGFLNLVSAAWINWFNAILFAVLLLLELLFMPETLYPRTRMLQLMPRDPSPYSTDIEQPQERYNTSDKDS